MKEELIKKIRSKYFSDENKSSVLEFSPIWGKDGDKLFKTLKIGDLVSYHEICCSLVECACPKVLTLTESDILSEKDLDEKLGWKYVKGSAPYLAKVFDAKYGYVSEPKKILHLQEYTWIFLLFRDIATSGDFGDISIYFHDWANPDSWYRDRWQDYIGEDYIIAQRNKNYTSFSEKVRANIFEWLCDDVDSDPTRSKFFDLTGDEGSKLAELLVCSRWNEARFICISMVQRICENVLKAVWHYYDYDYDWIFTFFEDISMSFGYPDINLPISNWGEWHDYPFEIEKFAAKDLKIVNEIIEELNRSK